MIKLINFFIITLFVSILISIEYLDIVELNDGTIIKGTIVETKPNEYIKIKSLDFDGSENIFIYQMNQINLIKKEEIKGYTYQDPNSSRYFFAPSATPIGKKNSYIRTTWLFFPSYGWGVSKNISSEIGMTVFPEGGIEDQLKTFSFKYSSANISKKWRSSFGFLYLGQIEEGGGFF